MFVDKKIHEIHKNLNTTKISTHIVCVFVHVAMCEAMVAQWLVQ